MLLCARAKFLVSVLLTRCRAGANTRWMIASRTRRLIQGLVKAHAHAQEGACWADPYVGFFNRTDPNGKTWPGSKTMDEVITRIKAIEAEITDPDVLLIAWGMDPIYFGSARMVAADLDKVSTIRPIYLLHINGHCANVNTAALRLGSITRDTQVVGVTKDVDGEPTGELVEFAAMFLVEPAAKHLLAGLGLRQRDTRLRTACHHDRPYYGHGARQCDHV
jgi:predicted amidohydrolase YtcJ